MKKILEFNIPDDNPDFEMANQGPAYHSVLWETCQKLRSYIKYGHKFESIEEAIEKINNDIYNDMFENKCHFQD